jgi:hypothetical protein
MIRVMSEPDNEPVGFFFGPGAGWEPVRSAGSEETAPDTSAAAEPAARTAPAASTEPDAPPMPAAPVETAQPPTPAVPAEPAASTVPVDPAQPPPPVPAEPAAWTVPVDPAQPPAPVPAIGPDPTPGPAATTGTPGEATEKYSVVNPDGSTTTQLPDGSFQTVVRLPGGATIVTSTSPPGSSRPAAPADPPRERRWRKRDR